MSVVTAERGGTIRESLAIGKAYAEARKHHGESQLLDAMVASPPALDPARAGMGGKPSAIASRPPSRRSGRRSAVPADRRGCSGANGAGSTNSGAAIGSAASDR